LVSHAANLSLPRNSDVLTIITKGTTIEVAVQSLDLESAKPKQILHLVLMRPSQRPLGITSLYYDAVTVYLLKDAVLVDDLRL
jgi:hypothetical protein